jgi:transposase
VKQVRAERPDVGGRAQGTDGAGPGRGGRMSRQRKTAAVLQLLRGGEDLETVSRSLGVTAATLTAWRDAFLAAGEAALASRPGDGEELQSQRLKAKLGEVMIERELLNEKIAALEAGRPFGPAEAEVMSRTISPVSGKPYGLALVCRRVPRATVYRHRGPQLAPAPQRPGPVGPLSDAALLEQIRTVLAASPFHGEGHRKIWARLRYRGVSAMSWTERRPKPTPR